jgi:hypothetical protein
VVTQVSVPMTLSCVDHRGGSAFFGLWFLAAKYQYTISSHVTQKHTFMLASFVSKPSSVSPNAISE